MEPYVPWGQAHVQGGHAGRETVLLIFQPTHLIIYLLWSVWKNIEKNKNKKFPRFVSMEMVAIFDFRALTKVNITLKQLLQMQCKVAHT